MRLRRDVNSGGFPITLQSSFHILGRCQNSGLGFHFARRPRWITIIACPQFLTFCVSFRPLRPDAGGLRHLVSGRGRRNVRRRPPSKHGAFTQCCFNVGPPSPTLAQHRDNIGQMPRVFWQTPDNDRVNWSDPSRLKTFNIRWFDVVDGEPTLNQHWFNVLLNQHH